eukprot:scaffold14520_cov63-Phaeocystis_antarctica.AAC.7
MALHGPSAESGEAAGCMSGARRKDVADSTQLTRRGSRGCATAESPSPCAPAPARRPAAAAAAAVAVARHLSAEW